MDKRVEGIREEEKMGVRTQAMGDGMLELLIIVGTGWVVVGHEKEHEGESLVTSVMLVIVGGM